MAAGRTLSLLLLQIIVTSLFCGGQARTNRRCRRNFNINNDNLGPFEIQSPNYPNHYGNKVLCEWNFIPNFQQSQQVAGVILQVSFSGRINIRSGRRCRADYVEIRAGSRSGRVLARYCGRNRHVQTVQHNGPLYIRFRSNKRRSGRGFKATISVNLAAQALAQAPPRPQASRSAVQGTQIHFTRWGRNTCAQSQTFVYSGYAAGFSSTGTSGLTCVRSPVTFSGSDITMSGVPVLSVAKFSLQGVTGALSTNVDNKAISCSVCNGVTGNEKMTAIGFENCNRWFGFTTAYSGYLMTLWFGPNSNQPSETICMDGQPTLNSAVSSSSSPQLRYLKSGSGALWTTNKLIRCAVCVKLAG